MINLFSTSPRILWPILSSFIPTLGEGNGTPLQYSCLENPMDGGAWKAVVRGVATEWLYFYFSRSCIGEGNGNPLQCSCLENPRDRGASWAAVYGVAQSRTRLKWLSSSSSSNSVGFLFLQTLSRKYFWWWSFWPLWSKVLTHRYFTPHHSTETWWKIAWGSGQLSRTITSHLPVDTRLLLQPLLLWRS